jgi:hypothetical protein
MEARMTNPAGTRTIPSPLAGEETGTMWPTALALTGLTAADEARIGALVKQAVS